MLQIPSGDLRRKELWDGLTAKNARLTVLLTDTCNVWTIANLGTRVAEQRQVRGWGYTPLETLLLGHRGQIDVSASDRDQFSWFTSDYGGWFTISACRILRNDNDWPSVYHSFRTQINDDYVQRREAILASPNANLSPETRQALIGQTAMTPRAFVFNISRDDLSLAPPEAAVNERSQTVTVYADP